MLQPNLLLLDFCFKGIRHTKILYMMVNALMYSMAFISGNNFGFTGAESSLVLVDYFPWGWSPVLQITNPDTLLNLSSLIGTPSKMALPNQPPQYASLNAVNLEQSPSVGGVA
jgi:hypothetical protein